MASIWPARPAFMAASLCASPLNAMTRRKRHTLRMDVSASLRRHARITSH
jgi:hypothetical protein